MRLIFRLESDRLVLITSEQIIGRFLFSYFTWIDELPRIKNLLFEFLEKITNDDLELNKTHFGTYDDLFIKHIAKDLIEIFDGNGLGVYAYEGCVTQIPREKFKEIASIYINEIEKFLRNPFEYRNELEQLGGEKTIVVS